MTSANKKSNDELVKKFWREIEEAVEQYQMGKKLSSVHKQRLVQLYAMQSLDIPDVRIDKHGIIEIRDLGVGE